MRTVLYMAISVNGIIAKEDDDTSWVSEIEWGSYQKMIQDMGNVVIGRRTFEVALREGDFPFPNCLNVIVADQEIENKWKDNVVFVKTPGEALRVLEERGFTSALVGGGGSLNASFMKENLIDEIYLDVEPIAFGKGIRLFAEGDFEAQLELVETRKLSENEIQLHYRVIGRMKNNHERRSGYQN